VPSLVKIDSLVLERKSKMYKFTDGRRTMGDQKSSLELSAQVANIRHLLREEETFIQCLYSSAIGIDSILICFTGLL
jgi:hypothetical protein